MKTLQTHVQEAERGGVGVIPGRYAELPERLYTELTQFLSDHPDLTPACMEALAGYLYNQTCVDQEIVRPSGQVEHLDPPQPDLSMLDFDRSRFLYHVKAWYDAMIEQLKRLQGDWESWSNEVFRCVERDVKTGETIYWTVRDFTSEIRSTWLLQVEQDFGELNQYITFVVFHEISAEPREARPQNYEKDQTLLLKTYQAYCQRVNRLLHLLQHLHNLGMRSVQEYQQWCEKQGLSPELLKTVPKRRQELRLLRTEGLKHANGDSDWFKESVTRIYENKATEADLRTAYLKKITRAFAGGLAGTARRTYMELLLHVEQHANLWV